MDYTENDPKLNELINKVVNEKWAEEAHTDPAKKGMWDGYSVEDLEKAKKNASGTRLKEIDFAIRAKTGWGKA